MRWKAIQRAANEPSFEWSRDLVVGAPRPDQQIPMGGRPLPPAQRRDLVDEASKLRDQQPELPAADSDPWQARPAWIDRGRSAVRARRHRPRTPQSACAEIRLCGAWHRAPAVDWTLLLQPPPHAAIGRCERALSSALMPGCPTRGRRSQTSTGPGPTLLRSRPNTRVKQARSGYARTAFQLSRASRFACTSSDGAEPAAVSSTDSRARRGWR